MDRMRALKEMPDRSPRTLFREGSEALIFIPGFFTDDLIARLRSELVWRQNKIRVYGRWYDEPRLTTWYGPEYTYSGIRWPSSPLVAVLEEIAGLLAAETGFPFNSVLGNWYRDGRDSMGWHRDNEPEMDQSLIASVSFGSSRRFLIRERGGERSFEMGLGHGSVLLMQNMQERWEHAVPKTSKPMGERINLTFRRIRVKEELS